MKAGRIIPVLVLGLLVIAVLVLQKLARAKAYSGPGIPGNLRSIEIAKQQWLEDGGTNAWPTAEDLFPSSAGESLQDILRPRYGEIYFINQTGAPPFAYIPKATGRYRGGEILVLKSNGVEALPQ